MASREPGQWGVRQRAGARGADLQRDDIVFFVALWSGICTDTGRHVPLKGLGVAVGAVVGVEADRVRTVGGAPAGIVPLIRPVLDLCSDVRQPSRP